MISAYTKVPKVVLNIYKEGTKLEAIELKRKRGMSMEDRIKEVEKLYPRPTYSIVETRY